MQQLTMTDLTIISAGQVENPYAYSTSYLVIDSLVSVVSTVNYGVGKGLGVVFSPVTYVVDKASDYVFGPCPI